MRIQKNIFESETYYIWVGGSCDYAHKERCSGGAYIIEKDGKTIDSYIVSETGSTEFRMILTVMIHAMEILPEKSSLVFMTNVAYIQNFDKEPTEKSANADLIQLCRQKKLKHQSVSVKIIPFHKYIKLTETHEMAHEAMLKLRNQ